MKKFRLGIITVLFAVVLCLFTGIDADASGKDTISAGVYAGDISLGGLSQDQARQEIERYIEQIKEKAITLKAVEEHETQVLAEDLGIKWANPGLVEEAMSLGKTGNIVQRYKVLRDLKKENKVYPIEFTFDRELVLQIIQDQCTPYNIEPRDATLTRVDDRFVVEGGQTGYVVDEQASLTAIIDFLNDGWNKEDAAIELVVIVKEPRGSEEELSKLTSVLGTFTTSYSSSGSSRSSNVSNGSNLINGTTLYPGDEFSSYQAVSPFSADNGYFMAGSYLNGQVVDSIGGGICQVTTTLYNTVLLAELEITERHNHSMIVSYVDPSADAAIAEAAGKDFKFVNNLEHPVYIEGYTTPDKKLTFTIYGVETRPAERTVEYFSEIISTTHPDSEVIYTSESHPVGYVSVQSAHTGYKANLWKIIKENNVEVSREKINSSSYKMVPRYATVGVVTVDPNVYNEIMAAISTNNIDHVKNVAAQFVPQPVDAVPPQEQPGEAVLPQEQSQEQPQEVPPAEGE